MPESNPTPTPPAAAPGTEGGTPGEKLIAGKYKSVDEAIAASESAFHSVTEKISNLTRLLEAAVAPQEPVATVPQAGRTDDPYGRNQNAFDPAAFITNPIPHLEARESALLGKVVRVVQDVVGNSMAVADFKSRHPELVNHEPLVQTFMRRVDKNKSTAEQLEEAAKLTVGYLNSLKAANNSGNPPPMGENYVEPPRGSQPLALPKAQPAPSDEQALVDYIAERNATRAQNFGMGLEKK